MAKYGDIDFDDYVVEELKKHPELIPEYLKEAIDGFYENGDVRSFLSMLELIAKAKKGGISALAEGTGLNRSRLYGMFKNGNPTLSTLQSILKYLGFRLDLKPVQQV